MFKLVKCLVVCVFGLALIMMSAGRGGIISSGNTNSLLSQLLTDSGFVKGAYAQKGHGGSHQGGGHRAGGHRGSDAHHGRGHQGVKVHHGKQHHGGRHQGRVHHKQRGAIHHGVSRYHYPYYRYPFFYFDFYPSSGATSSYDNYYNLCQSFYKDGTYPGQVIAGNCHIIYGKGIVSVSDYDLLTGTGYSWIPSSEGKIPSEAVMGGYHHGRPIYICGVDDYDAFYPGRIIGKSCYINHEGTLKVTPDYKILVKD